MRKKRITMALLLIITAVLMFSLSVLGAESASVLDYSRYLTDASGFTPNGCDINAKNDFIDFTVKDYNAGFSATAKVPNGISANTLLITLENKTSATNIMLVCQYKNKYKENDAELGYSDDGSDATGNVTENFVTKTYNISTDAKSPKHTYDVYIGEENLSLLVGFSFKINNTSSGYIRLYSISCASMYHDDYNNCGEFSSCSYNSVTKTVTLTGTVNQSTFKQNLNGKLELYSISSKNDEAMIILGKKEPLAKINISAYFSISAADITLEQSLSKFVVVLYRNNSTRLFLRSPVYAANDKTDTVIKYDEKSDFGFKGIDTQLLSEAIDSGADVAVVNVFVDKLINTSDAGYLFNFNGKKLYFDRDYQEQTDKTIKNLFGTGCRVYVRLLLSEASASSDIPCVSPSVAMTADSKYPGLYAGSMEAKLYIYAVTEYICSRYSTEENGYINGIIVGRSVDRMSVYNNIGSENLSDYSENYTELLYIISRAAFGKKADMKIIVPVSDVFDDPTTDISATTDSYLPTLFLRSICVCMKNLNIAEQMRIEYTGGGRETGTLLSVMLESGTNPFATLADTDIKYEAQSEPENDTIVSETGNDNGLHITAENISLFDDFIQNINSEFDFLNGHYAYFWQPKNNASNDYTSASYAYNYYKLFFNARTDAFIVSSFEQESMSDTARERDLFSQLKQLIKHIDTASSTSVTDFAVTYLGISSWEDEISGFDANALTVKTIDEADFVMLPATDIIGEYTLWNFTSVSSRLDWYKGAYCTDLFNGNTTLYGRTLAAKFDVSSALSGEYAYIAYKYENAENLCIGNYLSFDLTVSDAGDDISIYEVKITLSDGKNRIECKQIVKNKGTVTLNIDVGDSEYLQNATYIGIAARKISGSYNVFNLYLDTIKTKSTQMNDIELEEAIALARASSITGSGVLDENKNQRVVTVILASFGAVVAILVVSVMLNRLKSREDENNI